jgi:nitronate monooxygenase
MTNPTNSTNPLLIQGGMGVGVSNWRLAQAVSKEGQLGVVSGTMLDTVFARRLQDGDEGGHMQRACQHFPVKELVDRVWQRYYREGGKPAEAPYVNVPMIGVQPTLASLELIVLANFAEVYLAKEGHQGKVGINYLEKIQLPTLPSLYGAMLAGVDYVLMGAGIPKAIPSILDGLSEHKEVSLKLNIQSTASSEGGNDATYLTFNPRDILLNGKPLKRPDFLAIVSSHTLAANIAKKASGKVNGFVIENHTAGGHNAPPRGTLQLSSEGEPIYTKRDEADLEELKKLGLPFWLAGMYGSAEKLQEALALGAAGVQVGTPFAFCKESGITEEIKLSTLQKVLDQTVTIFTDPCASASGYPFKITNVDNSLSESTVYQARERVCDLGYLRSAYNRNDGSIAFRCPGEAEADYVKKGGLAEDTFNRKCLCNALLSNIGLGQTRSSGYEEPPLVTAGDHIAALSQFLSPGETSYSARSVIDLILGKKLVKA